MLIQTSQQRLNVKPDPLTATRVAGHVSSKVEKAGLRAMLLASTLAPELQRLRQRLGYAGPGPANGSAASRNWMLHALARYEEDAAPRAQLKALGRSKHV